MATGNPDPVERWAPLFTQYFKDDQILNPAYALSRISSPTVTGSFCKLCDAPVPSGESDDQHMRQHKAELRAWRKRRAKESAEKSKEGLRAARAEKQLQAKLAAEAVIAEAGKDDE